jgi:glucose/arabinose dehydrogenase
MEVFMQSIRQTALCVLAAGILGVVISVPVKAEIPTGVEFEKFYDQAKISFLQPTYIGMVPNDPGQIVIVERAGKVWRLVGGGTTWEKKAWFTVDANVHTHWDGAWNVTFHPKFAQNHLFYVLYRTKGGDTHSVLEEWTCDADLGNPKKVRDIITFRQANTEPDGGIHSSGDVHFGADGLLYTSQGDRHLFDKGAPDMSELWGKVSRIDVDKKDAGKEYAIPSTNPYIGKAGVRPEIWATGFRVPYRFSFDRLNGDLMLGDVGDLDHEEVNYVQAGHDYGSGKKDGSGGGGFVEGKCTANCAGLTDPVLELPHGCVIGGVVYRNDPSSAFYGAYIYADYQRTQLLALRMNDAKTGTTETKTLGTPPGRPSTMGIDAVGNIYVGTYVEAGSTTQIYRLKHVELRPASTPITPIAGRSPKTVSLRDLASANYRVYGLDGKLEDKVSAAGKVTLVRDVKTGETRKWVQLP